MKARPSLHAGVILMLALRNLRRNLRRTISHRHPRSSSGGALLTFVQTFDAGTHEQMVDSGVRTGSGARGGWRLPGFRVGRRIEDRLPGSTLPLVSVGGCGGAGRRSRNRRLLPIDHQRARHLSASGARGAQILGVDPTIEASLSPLDEQVVEGRYLEKDDRLAAYVGAGLVDALDLRIGSRLVLMAQDAHKEVAGQLVRVVGIFRTGPRRDSTSR